MSSNEHPEAPPADVLRGLQVVADRPQEVRQCVPQRPLGHLRLEYPSQRPEAVVFGTSSPGRCTTYHPGRRQVSARTLTTCVKRAGGLTRPTPPCSRLGVSLLPPTRCPARCHALSLPPSLFSAPRFPCEPHTYMLQTLCWQPRTRRWRGGSWKRCPNCGEHRWFRRACDHEVAPLARPGTRSSQAER